MRAARGCGSHPILSPGGALFVVPRRHVSGGSLNSHLTVKSQDTRVCEHNVCWYGVFLRAVKPIAHCTTLAPFADAPKNAPTAEREALQG